MFGIIGRKARAGGLESLWVKCRGSTRTVHWILAGLSAAEGGGIPGVAVKCVDIRRNTCGVDGLLDGN